MMAYYSIKRRITVIPEYAHHYHIQRIYKVEIPVKKLREFGAPKRQHLTDLTDNSQFLDPNKNNLDLNSGRIHQNRNNVEK